MTQNRHSSTLPTPVDYPDPVLRYSSTDTGTVIEEVNDAFSAVFGSPPAESSVEAVLNIQSPTVADTLNTGGTISVTVGGETDVESAANKLQYHGRVVPPGEQQGYIVFVSCGHNIGVDRVASVISHDLRNPLDVAKAHLEAIDDMTTDGKGKTHNPLSSHLSQVEQAHGRMERIIDDVLMLARDGDNSTADESVTLAEIAECAWQTVDTGAATLSVDHSLQVTRGDPDRLSRLFENLFRNTIEHGTTSVDSVSVQVGPLADGFFVEDDGHGIPTDQHEHVFTPGQSQHRHGTGLGLAIVKRIAEQHGWSVSATEADSGGARFEFRGVTAE